MGRNTRFRGKTPVGAKTLARRLSGAAGAGVLLFGATAALAQTPPDGTEIPQSVALGHRDTLTHLEALAKHPGRVGAVSRETLELVRKHIAREGEYILPPLTLLPYLADGKVSPDMKWAIAMADRVRADREVVFQEHTRMNTLLTELRDAGRRAHDAEAVDFAVSDAVESLDDMEIQEPTVLLIGEYLKLKLAPAK